MAITGGTGALGLITAKFLVERGNRHMVLLSRSGHVAVSNQPLWDALQAVAKKMGCTLEVMPCSIEQPAQVRLRPQPTATPGTHLAGCVFVLVDEIPT